MSCFTFLPLILIVCLVLICIMHKGPPPPTPRDLSVCSVRFFWGGFILSVQRCKTRIKSQNGMRKSLTAVIWTPPLNADVEFVAGRHVGSQRHTLVVDILFVSYPNLTERAWWDLETQNRFSLYQACSFFFFISLCEERSLQTGLRTKAWHGKKAGFCSMSRQVEQSLVEQLSSRRRLWLM